MSIKQNISKIKKTLPGCVTLVAATKTRTAAEIEEATKAGITIIGENYVQEAEKKIKQLKNNVQVHCIGHLQTNKVKKAVGLFDMIQTVDSIKLAKEIDKQCKKINKTMPVLIEVNIGKEKNKTGAFPEDVISLAKEISVLPSLKLKGLMTMAPYFEETEDYRPYYRKTKQLFVKLKSLNIRNTEMEILSMGMSDSYKVAVEEGSTMVRLGGIIFGKRK